MTGALIEIRVTAASRLPLTAKTKVKLIFESITSPEKKDAVAVSVTTL